MHIVVLQFFVYSCVSRMSLQPDAGFGTPVRFKK